MAARNRRFSQEFKDEAVRMVLGDAGGGLFTESHVVAEAGQVLVAALGLQLGRAAPGLGEML
ncbi:hypothetical protein [Nonomuraea diastatica]|uniref:hypothetical protein n=1 Tax=Nonomuraea diastatica TaxID=1848329 RepID=UPI00140937E6|nr:hypothetical protein [Nonomuraea diastatica]